MATNVERGCFCCSGSQTAAKFVGIVEVARTIIVLVANIIIYAESTSSVQRADVFGLVVVICGSLALFVTVSAMLNGIKNERSVYLIPHILMQGCVIGFYSYLFIQNTAYYAYYTQNYGSFTWFFLVFDLAVVLTEVWFTYIVCKCYSYLRIRNAAITTMPVQYIIPSVNEQNERYIAAFGYQPSVLNVPPPLYETVMEQSKFNGSAITSQTNKMYA